MSTVWIVSQDDGWEGLRAPSAAFLNEAEARNYAEHVRRGVGNYAVNEVPVMRFVPARVEPVDADLSEPAR